MGRMHELFVSSFFVANHPRVNDDAILSHLSHSKGCIDIARLCMTWSHN
jgi:hypothetical protein